MGTRNYRSWDTISSGYVPRRTYTTGYTTSQPYYNPYSSYRSYYRTYRSLENSAPHTPSSGTSSSGQKFDFVNGRYTTDNRYTTLRDTLQPTYYQQLTDLFLTTSKLQQDYRNILDRYNTDRASGYGGGLPEGYGPPRYMRTERAPPSERYDLYDRRAKSSRHYDTDITQYDYPHYERSRRQDYHGSVGTVLYNKDLHRGSYQSHDTGPGTREDLDLWEHTPGDGGADRAGYEREDYHREGTGPRGYPDTRYGYDRDGYDSRDGDRSRDTGDNNRHNDINDRGSGGGRGGLGGGGGGGGLKKSASRCDVDGYTRNKGYRGEKLPGISDDEYDDDFEGDDFEGDDFEGDDFEGYYVGEKGKYDSGIHSEDDDLLPGNEDLFEEEALPELEPEPEICVYAEITLEEFRQMQEEEAAKEEPLCDYLLIATVTTQLVKIEKIVGEFKRDAGADPDTPISLSPLPGRTSCYVTTPLPPDASTPSDPLRLSHLDITMATSPNPPAAQSEAHEVKLELVEPLNTPLGLSAKVVQVGEETIVTETVEEVVEEIPPESTVSEQVRLTLHPEMPEEYGDIAAKPVDTAPDTVKAADTAPVHEPAPEVTPKETEITMTPATTRNEDKKTDVSTEKLKETAVAVKIESEAAEIIRKDEQASKSAEKQPKVNGEIKEVKPGTKGGVKKMEESRDDNGKTKEAKPKSAAAKPKAPAENTKLPEKKGRFSKFGQSTAPSRAPAGAPKKKRLW